MLLLVQAQNEPPVHRGAVFQWFSSWLKILRTERRWEGEPGRYLKQFILTSAMQWSCFLLTCPASGLFLRSFSSSLLSFLSFLSPDLVTDLVTRLLCGGQEHLLLSWERVSSTRLRGLEPPLSSIITPTGRLILRYFLQYFSVKFGVELRADTPDLLQFIELSPQLLDLFLDNRLGGEPGVLLGQTVGLTRGVSSLQMTDLVGQVQHDRAQGSNLLHARVGQASNLPDQERGAIRAGTFLLPDEALLDLPGATAVSPADPVLVLQTGQLVLLLLALSRHLPLQIFLTFGEAHLAHLTGLLHLISQAGHCGVSLVRHLPSLDQERLPDSLSWLGESLQDTSAVHTCWRSQSGDVEEGWSQVNVKDGLVPEAVGLDSGTSHEEGNVGVEIIGESLPFEETKLPEMIS